MAGEITYHAWQPFDRAAPLPSVCTLCGLTSIKVNEMLTQNSAQVNCTQCLGSLALRAQIALSIIAAQDE